MEGRYHISSPFSFPSENRAASVRADINKENIPSSGGSSSGSVGDDTGSSMDSQGRQSGHAERTPKARKSKHSPTLVQLTDNQDTHAVSHHVFYPHLFFIFVICHLLGSVSTTILCYCVFFDCFLSLLFIFSLTMS